MDLLIAVRRLATIAHGEQKRRDNTPYIEHPIRVAAAAAAMGLDMDCQIAGLCHDVIEDTDWDEIALRKTGLFTERAIVLIVLLTKKEGETSDQAIDRIIESDDLDAMLLKVCDLRDNQILQPGDNCPDHMRMAMQYAQREQRLLDVIQAKTSKATLE